MSFVEGLGPVPLALLVLALLAWPALLAAWMLRLRRRDDADAGVAQATAAAVAEAARRLERELRDELLRSAQGTRIELGQTLGDLQRTLLAQQGDVARTQNEQIDSFRGQLAAMQVSIAEALKTASDTQLRHAEEAAARQHGQAQSAAATQQALAQAAREAQDLALQRFGDAIQQQLRAMAEHSERRLADVRQSVEQRLAALQQGNEQKLEQMRLTVDEKLQATLEQRLGASFRQVAERLEQVHRGLGEMQVLAKDVGALNRVLTNVKTRGIYGEVQLAGLLEQVFTPEQYAANVETVPGTGARVEFALRLPGRREDGQPLWLPIDAKFPREDHERLLDAQERADGAAVEAAAKAIEVRLRLEARSIATKYLAPPHTTDFAILFLPTEGLYAEALRRPGLLESLQREHKVMLAGPTTLLATLNSLQMGFRTLALERRSAEVWEVLGAVKTEFAKFGDVLAKTKKKLDEASNTIEAAQTRTRVMGRRLKSVEGLAEAPGQVMLPGVLGDLLEHAEDDGE
jgi:DNA recombination protein RmuC